MQKITATPHSIVPNETMPYKMDTGSNTVTGVSEYRSPQVTEIVVGNISIWRFWRCSICFTPQIIQEQLTQIRRKDFFELTSLKKFQDKVVKGDDDFYFQDVTIEEFKNSKDGVSQVKNKWVTLISEAAEARWYCPFKVWSFNNHYRRLSLKENRSQVLWWVDYFVIWIL